MLFNIFINDLLQTLHASKKGVSIGAIVISALGFADDVILMIEDHKDLQALIDICERWGRKNGMNFNIKKCNVLVLNGKRRDLDFKLYGASLEKIDSSKYNEELLPKGTV